MKSFIKKLMYKQQWVIIGSWVHLKWNNINIWTGTYINGPNTILHSSDEYSITIWKYSSISWWVSIMSKNKHNYKEISTNGLFMKNYSGKKRQDIWAAVVIWNDVWIWAGSIILPWVQIGDGSVIWAGSVVTKNIESYSIYAWNPATFVKSRFDKNIVKKLKQINWNNIDKNTIQEIEKKHGL